MKAAPDHTLPTLFFLAFPTPKQISLEDIGHYPRIEDPFAVAREFLALVRPRSD